MIRWTTHGVYDRAHLDTSNSRWAGAVWPYRHRWAENLGVSKWGWSAGERGGTAPTREAAREAVRLALGVPSPSPECENFAQTLGAGEGDPKGLRSRLREIVGDEMVDVDPEVAMREIRGEE